MNANSRQVGGEHYDSMFQHWDFVITVLDNRYLEGQITKYVARWRKKSGVQDVEKAIHYFEKLREEYVAGHLMPAGYAIREVKTVRGRFRFIEEQLARFAEENRQDSIERRIFRLCATWDGAGDLNTLEHELQLLLEAAKNSGAGDPFIPAQYR